MDYAEVLSGALHRPPRVAGVRRRLLELVGRTTSTGESSASHRVARPIAVLGGRCAPLELSNAVADLGVVEVAGAVKGQAWRAHLGPAIHGLEQSLLDLQPERVALPGQVVLLMRDEPVWVVALAEAAVGFRVDRQEERAPRDLADRRGVRDLRERVTIRALRGVGDEQYDGTAVSGDAGDGHERAADDALVEIGDIDVVRPRVEDDEADAVFGGEASESSVSRGRSTPRSSSRSASVMKTRLRSAPAASRRGRMTAPAASSSARKMTPHPVQVNSAASQPVNNVLPRPCVPQTTVSVPSGIRSLGWSIASWMRRTSARLTRRSRSSPGLAGAASNAGRCLPGRYSPCTPRRRHRRGDREAPRRTRHCNQGTG